MAVVLDSAGSSLLRHGSSRSCVAHLASPGSSTRLAFPVCSGLRRIATLPRASSASSVPQRRSSRAIVCEQQQETIAPSVAGVVSDDTWKELVLDSDVPVLVDFWAPWCGPCRMIAPIVDELALQYAGRVKCLKINTDECPKTATEYGIRSIPTVMIFKGGQKKDTIIGAVPKAALTAAIDKYLDR